MTQTDKLPAPNTQTKTKKTKSTGTQTFLTSEYLSRKLSNSQSQLVSSATQTAPVESDTSKTVYNTHSKICAELPNPTLALEMQSTPLDLINESSEEEFVELAEDESDEEIEDGGSDFDDEKTNKQFILSSNKLPQDQMKFIVFDESIVNKFGVCSTCKSTCIVSLKRSIGTYCKIAVSCSGDSRHNFTWSTGPLYN